MRIPIYLIALFLLSFSSYAQQKAIIYFGDLNSINGDTVDVQIVLDNQSGSAVAGYQFNILNIDSIQSIYGGSSQALGSHSYGGPPNNTVLGFDFSLVTIPPDSSVFINVVYTDRTLDDTAEACLSGVVLSDINGVSIPDSISIYYGCINTVISSLFDVPPGAFRVYPNPTNGALIVEGDINSVELYDISGKRLVTSNDNSLQLSDFSDGVYILSVLDKLGNRYKYKVLKE